MKRRFLSMLLLTALLVISACSQPSTNDTSSSKGEQLIISIPAEAGTLDPAVSMDNSAWKITYPAYERLVAYEGDTTTVIPSLAKDWTISEDGLVYTFMLEEGHKFADGSEVNAEAVKFSFDRTLAVEKGPSGMYAEFINEISVIDSSTVQIKLNSNFPPFISTLAANYGSIINPKVMEHEKDGDLGQTYLSTNTMGSGPYQLEEYKKGQYYKLSMNPHTSIDPQIETVYFQISSDVSGTRLKLEKGEIDIAEGIPTDQINKLESAEGVKVVKTPSLLVDYVYLNIAKGNEAMQNKEVRQAISYAVNYESIIDQIMQGFGTQFRGPVPDGMWGHDPNAFMYSYDKEKAKSLLNESGYQDIELTLLYSDNKPYWEQLALVLQSNLGESGIDVKLNKVAYPTMREMLDTGDFDLALGVWSPDYGDPYMFMNYWFDSNNWGLAGNRSFYKNETVDDLIRKASAVNVQEEREVLYKQAQEIIIEDAVYVYLAQKQFLLPMRENINGFIYNPMLEGIYNLTEMSK